MTSPIAPGALVIVHLANPAEKLFGRLLELGPAGVALRGIGLASFDDWLADLAHGEAAALGPATVFLPLHRVERIFLDEPAGSLPSLADRLRGRSGRALDELL